jgi:hypothetical protein
MKESNEILLQRKNKNKTNLWIENVSKIGVEHIKYNVEFYLHLYLLSIYLNEFKIKNFQPTYGPCAFMCDPCVNYELIRNELRVKLELTKNELKINLKWIKSESRLN